MKRLFVYLALLFSSFYSVVSIGQPQTFASYSGFEIQDMVVYKDDLYVIGYFDTIGGVAANQIARFDGTQWHSLPIHFADYFNTTSNSFEVYKDELYIARRTSDTIPEPLKYEFITKWDGVTWSVLEDSSIYFACPVFCDGVFDMAVYDSLLFVGGDFRGTSASPNFIGLGTWDGSNWVVGFDTTPNPGFGRPYDLEVNSDGLWIEGYGVWKWDGIQFMNSNHPDDNQRNSLIAGENFVYADGYINYGSAWNLKLLKRHWNDHIFVGDDLLFTRNGVLYKMDTATFNVTTMDSLVPTLGYTAYQMTFFNGKLILGLTFGLDTNGSFLYSIDSTQVVSGIKKAESIRTKIYPNPSKGYLILESSEIIEQIEIKDLTGTTLYKKEENSFETKIDVTEIPNGLYLISIVTRSGIRQIQKVIIQH
jgi:hypothetical protein